MNNCKIIVFQVIIVTLVTFSLNCTRNASQEEQSKIPNDIKWVRSSIEYQAICIQTYRWAWSAVKEVSKQINVPWVVVLDVDETVLENSAYEAMIAGKGLKYPALWAEWVLSAEADAVPGAKAFLDSIRTLGKYAHVAFITNRDSSFEKATIKNLKLRGIWTEDDMILTKWDKSDTKAVRRNEVITGTGRCSGTAGWKIIALIGDQLNDVSDYASGTSPEGLRDIFKDSSIWGTVAFVLPNPMYGSWLSGY